MSKQQMWALWIAAVGLAVSVLPLVTSALAALMGDLTGANQPGKLLLQLIERPGGPWSILQKIIIPALSVVSASILWRRRSGLAILLIGICGLGLASTLYLWSYLGELKTAGDLWQEAEGSSLNGDSFPDSMHNYFVTVTLFLVGSLGAIIGVQLLKPNSQ